MYNFEKIFERKIIKPNINYKIFSNKKILVTGSSGSIGRKIISKLKKYTKHITHADLNIDVTKKINIEKLKKTNFDLYGKITSFEETFNSIDNNINYIFPIIKKLIKLFFIFPQRKIINILVIIIFQIFYLFSMMKFKIKYKKYL